MDQLLHGPISLKTIHLCIDMQKLFSSKGLWPTPWMERVLPNIVHIVEKYPERTVFTRFIPPQKPEDMPGTWQKYYQHWRQATRDYVDLSLLELMPELARFVPPATVIDKPVYSPFSGHKFLKFLQAHEIDTLIITGSETDVCVLATILGAVDYGYRVIIVQDALCSSSDEGHDNLLDLYSKRFSQQIETISGEVLLSLWSA